MNFRLLTLLAVLSVAALLRAADTKPLEAVSKVDLARYAGTWYELARTPNRWEADCIGNVRVEYTMGKDGKLGIRNECKKKNGKVQTAKGYAKKGDSTSKLRLTFFWPFFADYWIIELDPDYKFAVIGEPKRRNLWLLGRSADVDPATYDAMVRHAAAKGYDVSRLVRTPQSPAL
jgi:apolipoprotein D and lipocalin family protein